MRDHLDGANLNAITPSTPDAVEQVSGMSFLDGFEVEARLAKAGPEV
jgi:hypothetical protein